ncbi:MAG: single-stranded-DNA-specific exonuclease RecJ [Bacteroidales bacterium]|nr:single-stranded-DNA-specific exonuclease RecJ [Bacteroidales bacterium]
MIIEKRWIEKKSGDCELVKSLSKTLNIDRVLSNLLVQRGISNFNEAKSFFRPEISKLHDPFLMKDMDKAISRIEEAIKANEKILIYGDYDVDGTTAVALVYLFIKSIYENVDFYIPDRYTEGYGISYKGIEYAFINDFKLIIALDCGIKAVEKIDFANSKNVDFIICDHHRPGEKIPQAVAVLDPKRDDCNYPFKDLSGCGVGFKLAQAFAQKRNIAFENVEKYLDLVAISIASDIVPVTGENRILAYYGLISINKNPRPGIEAILKYSNIVRTKAPKTSEGVLNKVLTISDIVFLVGPRINAAGRIESANNSVKLLVTDDDAYANQIGQQINSLNTERRNLDTQITQDAIEMIKRDKYLLEKKSTIVYHPEWHKGVIGIVASRLTEFCYRPTIVFTKSNDIITGSARSVKDFDIYNAIDACEEYLEHFGGHKYAAGLSLKTENYIPFCRKFEEVVSSTINDNLLIPEVEIDSKLNLNEINSKFFRILKQFAPFGPGNMAPVFLTNSVIDTGYARIVGKNHLKLKVVQTEKNGFPYDAIAFQQGEYLQKVRNIKPFNICYHIDENEWNGQKSKQLNIKDIKFDI